MYAAPSLSKAYAQLLGAGFTGLIIGSGGAPAAMLDVYGDAVFTSSAADVVKLIGSHSSRATLYVQATNSASQANLYFENNRGGFASYGGLLYGCTTNAIGNLFGVSRPDRMFLFADGASNLGLYIGTLGAQPCVLGTNNTTYVTLSSAGALRFHA